MVTKRDGTLEQINLDKIHRVITWAAEGLENVSVSQVELRSHIQFYEGIRTSDIHETIIKAAADLISKDTPDYQYLAARLAVFHLAGMPKSIVKRAGDILKQLEKDNRQQGIAAKPMVEVGETRGGMQLSFFQLDDPVLCQIRDEILNLDVNNLTPLEALNKLNDIKRIVKGK